VFSLSPAFRVINGLFFPGDDSSFFRVGTFKINPFKLIVRIFGRILTGQIRKHVRSSAYFFYISRVVDVNYHEVTQVIGVNKTIFNGEFLA
jgi:hypothetical protein